MAEKTKKLVQLLHIVSSAMKKTMCEASEMASGLTLAQFQLLEALSRQEKMTMADIANTFNIKPASATVMVDKLVEQGWLIRESGTNDRRKVWILISEKKKQEWAGHHKKKMENLAVFMNVLSEDQKDNFISILETLAKK